jgi:hypothetical protein
MSSQRNCMQAACLFKGAFAIARASSATAALACLLAAPALAQSLAPVANPGGPYLGDHNNPIFLDGTSSYDPNGLALTYAWDLRGGGVYTDSTSPKPIVSFDHPGTFPVCLQVSDLYKSAFGCTTVDVLNRVPVAAAGGPYLIGLGSGFVLDASGSFDPDGDSLSYAWDLKADGSFGDLSGVHPSVSPADSLTSFAAPGSYSIAVKVTDAFGASDIRYTTLSVAAVPEPATVALFLAGLLAIAAWTARGKQPTRQSL